MYHFLCEISIVSAHSSMKQYFLSAPRYTRPDAFFAGKRTASPPAKNCPQSFRSAGNGSFILFHADCLHMLLGVAFFHKLAVIADHAVIVPRVVEDIIRAVIAGEKHAVLI